MAEEQVRPNLFIVGAPKCGTSALHDALGQHPDVFMSTQKELQFFVRGRRWNTSEPMPIFRNNPPVVDEHAYYRHFEEGRDCTWRGESSVAYLVNEAAARRIHELAPDARIVAILRNPAERTYSAWEFLREYDAEPLAFDDALEAERAGVPLPSGRLRNYVRTSVYVPLVDRYLETFGSGRVKLIRYEDWRSSPGDVLADLQRFLDVAPYGGFTLVEVNPTRGVPSSAHLENALRSRVVRETIRRGPRPVRRTVRRVRRKLRQFNRAPRTPLEPAVRARLLEGFATDIERLDTLVPWDATAWLR